MSEPLGPAGRIGDFFIDSKLTPLLVIAALAVGAMAVVLTPREEEPQIVVPMMDVFVGMPGATPLEVENRITVPLEKLVWEIPGVEYVYSTSLPGQAAITARFLVGHDIETSLVKLYEKIAANMDRVPQGATPPLVRLRSIDDVPILTLTLWSHAYDGFGLRRVAAELAREIAVIERVSDVRLIGGQRRQVRVLLDTGRLAAFGLDPTDIAAALRLQNTAAPAGTFEEQNREVIVETGAFLEHPDEISELVVGAHGGRPIHLRDVAQVLDGPEEARDYVFFASGPATREEGAGHDSGLASAVTVSIAKRKGADAHRVVADVLAGVERLRGRLVPRDVFVAVTRDYGETSNEKARELLTHLMGAILSVTLVIALFLGWRGGIVVFVSVPVTFALTLFVYYTFGYTLNRVTLFALIFVTGIVVDDSIIVVENIVRHFAMRRLPAREAAIAAVNEVGNPTILATLTVIAAVLPMAFVRGLMGPYMRPMPIGAMLAMIFSLAVALVAAPWFAYRLLRGGSHTVEGAGYVLEQTWAYRINHRLLVPLLTHPLRAWAFLGGVFALLLLSVAMVPLKLVAVKMLPFDNKSEIQVILDMPEGVTLEHTTQVAQEVAVFLQGVPEVTDLQIYAGTAAPVNFNGLVRHYDLRRSSNAADIQVNLAHKHERETRSHDFAKRVRPPIEEIVHRHGGRVKVAEIPPGPPVLATLVAEVYGPTHDARLALAQDVLDVFESTPGVVDVDWYVESPQPKQLLRVDREKAALQGVAAATVARTLGMALGGESAGVLHDPNEREPVEIMLQLPRPLRSTIEDLARMRVASRSGAMIPLSEFITAEETVQPMGRYRKNLQPVVYVTADVAGAEESPVYAILDMAERISTLRGTDGGTVEQLYRRQPVSTEHPTMKWDGEWHISYEVFRDLGLAFAVVLVLIYMLIIAWFKSFQVPLVMMIAIPLSLIGILPGHWMFGAFFTATSMIGFIALAGIMVRNSVLLIDFVEQVLTEGKSLGEAVVEATAVRFRPIMLTAGTVVIGAVVILFDPIFEGLAISLMFGAIASTVLTLGVVPLVYFMVRRRAYEAPLPAEWTAKRESD